MTIWLIQANPVICKSITCSILVTNLLFDFFLHTNRVIEVCLRLWHRSKKGYEELRNSGLFKLPSGRTLELKKNAVRQSPGIQKEILLAMKQLAIEKELPVTAYHGFIVFDEMSVQVLFFNISFMFLDTEVIKVSIYFKLDPMLPFSLFRRKVFLEKNELYSHYFKGQHI